MGAGRQRIKVIPSSGDTKVGICSGGGDDALHTAQPHTLPTNPSPTRHSLMQLFNLGAGDDANNWQVGVPAPWCILTFVPPFTPMGSVTLLLSPFCLPVQVVALCLNKYNLSMLDGVKYSERYSAPGDPAPLWPDLLALAGSGNFAVGAAANLLL